MVYEQIVLSAILNSLREIVYHISPDIDMDANNVWYLHRVLYPTRSVSLLSLQIYMPTRPELIYDLYLYP